MNQEIESSISKGAAASPPNLAWRWLSILGPGLLVLAVDQLSKLWVLNNLEWGEPWAPIPALRSIFTFTLVTNAGAAFGLFKDGGVFFTLLALVVVFGILLYERHLPLHPFWLRASLGLMLGGATGNLADRLRFGEVIDFIDFQFWPVFNLADSAIVIGVGLVALYLWRSPKEESTPGSSI